jgi:hypothetical protein
VFDLNDTELRVNTDKEGTIYVHKVRTLRIDFEPASIKLMIVRFSREERLLLLLALACLLCVREASRSEKTLRVSVACALRLRHGRGSRLRATRRSTQLDILVII